MAHWVRLAFACTIALLSIATGAAAERRLALVIGNDAYRELPKLEKAVGDAAAMADALEKLGFDVTRIMDVDRRQLNGEIDTFAQKLAPTDIAFVHFSGHGVEIDGENFLLPVDAPKPGAGELSVKSEALSLNDLIQVLSDAGASTRLLVIDACRDNPYERVGVRSIGSTRGLSRVEAPKGTFIMYSAGYRQTALDRLGPDDAHPTSVYTRILIEELPRPGRSLAETAAVVRTKVEDLAASTGHVQRPAYYDELSAPLVLKAAPTVEIVPEPNEAADLVEITYWNSIMARPTSVALYEEYLQQYPNGRFVGIARKMLLDLKGEERVVGRQPEGTSNDLAEPNTKTDSDHSAVQPPSPKKALPKASERTKIASVDPSERRHNETAREDALWKRTRSSATARALNEYLKAYPNGRYSKAAKARLARLSKSKSTDSSQARKQPVEAVARKAQAQQEPSRSVPENCGVCTGARSRIMCGKRYEQAKSKGFCF